MTITINNKNKKPNVPNSTDKGNVIRNVPHLRFPEFEGEWEKCKLGDKCDLLCGYAFDGKNIVEQGTYLLMRGINITEGIIRHSSELDRYYTGSVNNLAKYKLTTGDLVIGMDGSKVGRNSAIVSLTENGSYLVQRVCRIKSCIGNDFILQLVNNHKFHKYVDMVKTSSAIPHISLKDIQNFPIAVPSIQKEADKISRLFHLLDERIATQNKIIEDLKKLKSAIIDYAINSLHCDFVKFGTLYEMAGEGGTPATSNAAYYDNGNIPFIKIDDLKQKYLTENKDFITELGLQKSSAWLIPTHSILFSNGATIGEISITTYPVCTKQGILGIVPKQNIDVEFLYYLMSSSYFKKAVSRIVTEGTMKTAYLKDINNILCPIPTKERQQEIAKMPSALNSKIDFEQSIFKLYGSQKQYLLRQMFI